MKRLSLRFKIALLSAATIAIVVFVSHTVLVFLYTNSRYELMDEQLRIHAIVISEHVQFSNNQINPFKTSQTIELNTQVRGQFYYQLHDHNRKPVLRSSNMIFIEAPTPNSDTTAFTGQNFNFAGKPYRVVSRQFVAPHGQRYYIQTFTPLAQFYRETARLDQQLFVLLVLAVAITLLCSWLLAGFALKPVNKLIDTVNRISADDLSRRIPVKGHDELGKIADTFNLFLGRLQASFESLKRFTTHASHELRTPLTVLSSQAEVALSSARTNTEYQDVLASQLEELNHLSRLVDSLLELARGDAGMITLEKQSLNLSKLVAKWVDWLMPLAEEKQIEVTTQSSSDPVVKLDEAVFERAFINVFENAIHYTPEGGAVQIDIECSGKHMGMAEIRICDTGPGIKPSQQSNIFDRFVRLESTRHRAHGFGLGLAIARWAMELHGGQIEYQPNTYTDNRTPKGSCFVLSIPYNLNNSSD